MAFMHPLSGGDTTPAAGCCFFLKATAASSRVLRLPLTAYTQKFAKVSFSLTK